MIPARVIPAYMILAQESPSMTFRPAAAEQRVLDRVVGPAAISPAGVEVADAVPAA